MQLDPDWQSYLEKLVAAGRYESVEAALDEALHDLLHRELAHNDLKAEIDKGVASGISEPFTFDEVAREARAEFEAERQARHAAE